MKRGILLLAGVLLLSGVVRAAPGESPDLLDQAVSGPEVAFAPLTDDELSGARGEGTIEKFIALPRLHRSFERVVVRDNLSVSIVGVAGEGITIRIENPSIP